MATSGPDIESLVQFASAAGLLAPETRERLLRGLPAVLVDGLARADDPIEQARLDLIELRRTPVLVGLDREPLAVWLRNAAEACPPEHAWIARVFGARAAHLVDGRGSQSAAREAPVVAPASPIRAGAAEYGESWDVFLAYSGPDLALAARICRHLRGAGWTVFFDHDSLVAGGHFDVRLPRALFRSTALVALISTHTAAAWYQLDEITLGIDMVRSGNSRLRRIVPVVLNGGEMPKVYGLARLVPIVPGADATPERIAALVTQNLRASREEPEPPADATPPSAHPALTVLLPSLASRLDDIDDMARHLHARMRSAAARRSLRFIARGIPCDRVTDRHLAELVDATQPAVVHVAQAADIDGALAGQMEAAVAEVEAVRGVLLATTDSAANAERLRDRVAFAIGLEGGPPAAIVDRFSLRLYEVMGAGHAVRVAFAHAKRAATEIDEAGARCFRLFARDDRFVLRSHRDPA